jgi:imidazolonepropionase-like amidohydrolase
MSARRRLPALLGGLAMAVLAASAQAPPPPSLVLMNVHVVPMTREQVLSDQTVVVQDGRITSIGPSASVRISHAARRIDGAGRYLIPALAEMHAHIPGGQASDAEIERVLFLYVANGIGTIRGMLGHPRHLPLRDRARSGTLVSPWIYTSGPSLNGNTVPTREAAVQAVKDQKSAGYDFLKIHPGVPRDPFEALAATAKDAGMPFAGHVPAEVGLQRALEVRYATIDHLDGYVEALAGPGAPASQMFGLNLVGRIDESRLPSLVAATRASGVAQVPTQALFEHWVGPDEPAAMARWPEMRFVEPAQLADWIRNKQELTAKAPSADRARFLELRRRLLKAMQDGGVRLLLGSDAPQVWNVPGFSLHRELEYLVRAGLTPYQALESGTRHIAEFFGTGAERGTIEVGRRADLVLVEDNPLKDIRQTSRIALVIVNGHVLTREEIDARLKQLERGR